MFSDLDLIGRGHGPGPIHRFRPIRPARPRRGDWHRPDRMPAPAAGPACAFWLLVAALVAGMALTAPHQPGPGTPPGGSVERAETRR